MEKIIKRQDGITLVALIITIIVMVILAGVIITAAVADGGIIERAKISMREQERADVEEIVKASYIFKEFASFGNAFAYIDIGKTADAMYENLTANGFTVNSYQPKEDGNGNTMKNDGTKIDIEVKGDHGTYQGEVKESGISKEIEPIPDLEDKGITVIPPTLTIKVGETSPIKAKLNGNLTGTINYKTSKESIVTVDEFGVVTGVSKGEATITATCGEYSATSTIIVEDKSQDVETIAFNKTYYLSGKTDGKIQITVFEDGTCNYININDGLDVIGNWQLENGRFILENDLGKLEFDIEIIKEANNDIVILNNEVETLFFATSTNGLRYFSGEHYAANDDYGTRFIFNKNNSTCWTPGYGGAGSQYIPLYYNGQVYNASAIHTVRDPETDEEIHTEMPITTTDNCETLLWNGLTLTLQKKIEHYDAKVDNVDLIQRIDYINLNCTTYEMIDVNEYVKKSEMPITFGDIIKEIVKIKVLEDSEIKEIELNEEIIPVIFNKDEENETTNYMVGNGMYVFVENESGEDYYIFYELVSETSDVDFREYRFSLIE